MVFFGAIFLAVVHSRASEKRSFFRDLLEIVAKNR